MLAGILTRRWAIFGAAGRRSRDRHDGPAQAPGVVLDAG